MELPYWKDEYSINNEEVDTQHQKLFAIIRELVVAIEAQKDKEVLDSIMHELVNYTSYHFSSEEEFMESINYPAVDFEKHKNEHAYLTDEVFEGLNQFSNRGGIVVDDLLKFLNNWLINHILGTDLKIKGFIEAKGC
ncbi:MAG: bacteriohemerythrin [Patescibacteria group bacterium]|nr:bacteriohemerythrin [Patescibacteria group bacterium]